MSINQLQNKIKELDLWLKNNPKHYDYCLNHQVRKRLTQKLNKEKK